MSPKIPTLAALALVVFGCSRSGKMQRDQKQYDVVPEGSASGVTSTINGPGETTPPVTDTNADTTTNFTIPNPNPLGNDTAGTAMTGSTTATTTPRPLRPRLYTPPPRPQELRPEPATDTTMTTTTATETTTTTTTTAHRQLQSFRQVGSDFLRNCANLDAMNMAMSSQAVVNEVDHSRWDGKAQSLAASPLRQDEGVDADHGSAHIDQWAAAVSGIDRRIRLEIGDGLGGVGLTRQCAQDTHGD